jgi:hypothetical protein
VDAPAPQLPPVRDGDAWHHFCLGRRSARGASAAAEEAAAEDDADAEAEAEEEEEASAPDAGDASRAGHAPSLRVLTSLDEVCAVFGASF